MSAVIFFSVSCTTPSLGLQSIQSIDWSVCPSPEYWPRCLFRLFFVHSNLTTTVETFQTLILSPPSHQPFRSKSNAKYRHRIKTLSGNTYSFWTVGWHNKPNWRRAPSVIIIIIIIIFRNRTMNQKFCRKFTISVSSKAFAQAIVIVC